MAELLMVKTPGGVLVPADDHALQALYRVKNGSTVRADVVVPRNARFLRKYMALLRVAFDIWSEMPGAGREHRGVAVAPDFEQFREDLTILAGHYTAVYRVDGSVRMKAKSISFAAMDDLEFERVYSATLQTILEKVIPTRGIRESTLRAWVDNIVGFG